MEERHDGQAAAEDKRAGLGKKEQDLQEHIGIAGLDVDEPALDDPDEEGHQSAAQHRNQRFLPAGPGADQQYNEPGQDEELRQLGLRPNGDADQGREDAPEERVALVGRARELVCRDRDDADDAGADPVEKRLHPPEAAVSQVSNRDRQDHQKRGHDEGEADQRGAQDAVLEVADGDGELGGQRAGHDLGQRQSKVVLFFADPLPLSDQVAVHEADQRDRTAEAERAEIEKIADELPEGHPSLLTAQ